MEHYNTLKNYIVVSFIIISYVMFWPHVKVHASSETTSSLEDISFYIVATIIGGIIIVTLTYVSAKKYKAEQKQRDKDENS